MDTNEARGLIKEKFVPEPLSRISMVDIKNDAPILKELGAPLNARMCLTLAMIHLFLGDLKNTIAFCDGGLSCVGKGIALIPLFEEIKRKAETGKQ